MNTARAKVSDEARSIEASGTDMSNQLDSVRELSDKILPYVNKYEEKRWMFGFCEYIFGFLPLRLSDLCVNIG